MLLAAGADPTIRTRQGHTPLDRARRPQQIAEHQVAEEEEKERAASCVALQEAAMVCEPERPRLLLRARDLIDTAAAVPWPPKPPSTMASLMQRSTGRRRRWRRRI